MNARTARVARQTRETDIIVELALDEPRRPDIRTGLRFLDHMLDALATHGAFGLTLRCTGDLDVDDHHTVEDCALVLGQALDNTLGERRSIARFGYAYAPLDEALARAVVDLSGRPFAAVNLDLQRDRIGDVASENLIHFFQSFATSARCALHLDLIRGENDHHRAEAAFKAFALALKQAVTRNAACASVPSTKGALA